MKKLVLVIACAFFSMSPNLILAEDELPPVIVTDDQVERDDDILVED